MKKINILYWTFTGLFSFFMLFSAIQNILVTQPSIDLITTQLGFPQYMIPFLGMAKLLGVIGILLPGYPRVKEWAYAGLFFDLLGATYAMTAIGPIQPDIAFMALPFIFMGLSYGFYHKREELNGKN